MTDETHYDLLEVEPGASEEELRRAFKRAKELYAQDSMVVYTLFTHSELEDLGERLDEAYETVIDPRTRREYDLSLIARSADPEPPPTPELNRRSMTPMDGEPRVTSPHQVTVMKDIPTSLPEGLELNEETVFTGALLQEIREHRDVDLRDMSNHTKISLMNLRYLEQMQYEELPAPVYIRGFLKEYARFLRLPGKQVADTYMSVYDETLGGNEEAPEQ